MGDRPLKRILLVDDDADLRAVATLALTGLGGYTVLSCSSAGEAVERAPGFRPDLILLDVLMPGTDGFGALRALRGIEATAETPVVFITTRVESPDLARYEELGCLGVIPKPFDPAELPSRIVALWGRHRGLLSDAYSGEFQALRRTYVDALPEKIAAMRAAAAELSAKGWDRPVLEYLYHLAHRMAGASGLYRLSSLSRSAETLEDILKRLLGAPAWPPPSSPVELTILVKAVDRAARQETGRKI